MSGKPVNLNKANSNKKVSNSLVAVSASAVLAVYAAGYTRTRSAAEQFEARTAAHRPLRHATEAEAAAPSPAPVKEAAPGPIEVASVKPLLKPTEAPKTESVPAEVAKVETPAPVTAAPTPEPTPTPVAVPAPVPVPAPAPAPVVAAAPVVPPPASSNSKDPGKPPWKDGVYEDWGTCRHGSIKAQVVIEGGRIVSAKIAECATRYRCDIIDHLPAQVVQRQSPDVDYVAGATQSADAFADAVYLALGKAK